jgi:hypothetical protein
MLSPSALDRATFPFVAYNPFIIALVITQTRFLGRLFWLHACFINNHLILLRNPLYESVSRFDLEFLVREPKQPFLLAELTAYHTC